MNVELAAPDRRNDQLPLAEVCLESFGFHTSCESNSIPLISFRHAAIRIFSTTFMHPHQRGQYGLQTRQIQGSSIYYGWEPSCKAAMDPVGDGESPDTGPDASLPSACIVNNTDPSHTL